MGPMSVCVHACVCTCVFTRLPKGPVTYKNVRNHSCGRRCSVERGEEFIENVIHRCQRENWFQKADAWQFPTPHRCPGRVRTEKGLRLDSW